MSTVFSHFNLEKGSKQKSGDRKPKVRKVCQWAPMFGRLDGGCII